MRILAGWLLFISCTFLLICVLAQARLPVRESARAIYTQADKNYQKALELSKSKNYSEAEADKFNEAALQQFISLLQGNHQPAADIDSLYFFAAVKAGELEHYFDSLPQALRYYTLSLRIKEHLPRLADSFLFKPCMFTGLIYARQNNLDSATYYLKKAEAIQIRNHRLLQESERLYNILGSIYFEYGNFVQAKNYFQKAAEVLSPNNPSYGELNSNYKINLATVLFKLEDYNAATKIYLSLRRNNPLFLNEINNNLGLIQLYTGHPTEAIAYFSQVTYKNYLLTGLYNAIANAYIKLARPDAAEAFLQKATTANKTYNTTALSIDYGRTLKTFGDLQKLRGQFSFALTHYQQALHQFYPAFTDTSIQIDPTQFTGAFSYINVFQTLVAKAETWHKLYQKTGELQQAGNELNCYKAAFKLIEYVERTYDSDEARLFLSRIKYQVHNQPIDIAFTLYQRTHDAVYLTALYNFDQQSKAAILALNRQVANTAPAASSTLLQQDQKIKSEITRLSIRALKITDSTQLHTVNNQIRDYEIELGKKQEELFAQPFVKENIIPSIATVQTTLLDDKTAIISYHLSETSLTTTILTKSKADCFQDSLPEAFHEKLQKKIVRLKSASTNFFDDDSTNYFNLFLSHLSTTGLNQLIIIPDDILTFFPFETLKNKGTYLIQQLAVQYQFSTALLNRNETDFSNASTLAFAPFAHQQYNDVLPQLPYSKEEISSLKATAFYDSNATKNAFLQAAPRFKILHLATHAVLNSNADNLSYIAFAPDSGRQDDLLYAQEIYNLPLQHTGLVILSACETGSGSLAKGEGILSISRAFTYAGCANSITSLWKADDFSTAYLTAGIHRYLNDHFSIAVAVQKAKMDYLNDKTINPRMKQPYYWAHLVFVGDYMPPRRVVLAPFVVAGILTVLLVILLLTSPRGRLKNRLMSKHT